MGNMLDHVVVKNRDTGELEVIDLLTGQVLSNSASSAPPPSQYGFDYKKALQIVQMVREGNTFAEITAIPDMPPMHVISHWQRVDRMFAEEMKLARKERGEHYHDKAMEIAQKAEKAFKDDVPGLSLAAKIYQWGAEKAKPESYGNKVTHEGSETKPILMRVINTGISRQPKPDVQIVEAEHIEVTDVIETKQDSIDGEDEVNQGLRPKRGRRSGDVSTRGTKRSRGQETSVRSED